MIGDEARGIYVGFRYRTKGQELSYAAGGSLDRERCIVVLCVYRISITGGINPGKT